MYSIVALGGKFNKRFKASLILEVVAWSEAVLFHILNKYSGYRVDTTTPQISLPAWNLIIIKVDRWKMRSVKIYIYVIMRKMFLEL